MALSIPNIQLKDKPGPSLGSLFGAGLGQGLLSGIEQFQKEKEKGPMYTPEDLGLEGVPAGLSGQPLFSQSESAKFLLRPPEVAEVKQALWDQMNLGQKENLLEEAAVSGDYGRINFLKTAKEDSNTGSRIIQRMFKGADISGKMSPAVKKDLSTISRVVPGMVQAAKAWKSGELSDPNTITAIQRGIQEFGLRGTGFGFRWLDAINEKLRGKPQRAFTRYMDNINRISEIELRKATGAATNTGEKIDYLSFMPMPGDTEDQISDKFNHLAFSVKAVFDQAMLESKNDPVARAEIEKERAILFERIGLMGEQWIGRAPDFDTDAAALTFDATLGKGGRWIYDPSLATEVRANNAEKQRREQSPATSFVDGLFDEAKTSRGKIR